MGVVDELLTEARAPLPERSHPLKAQDLVDLWHGDEHSFGYHHPLLVFRVLELQRYSNVDLLRALFYPRLADHEVPTDANETIVACYETWERRRAAKAKQEASR